LSSWIERGVGELAELSSQRAKLLLIRQCKNWNLWCLDLLY